MKLTLALGILLVLAPSPQQTRPVTQQPRQVTPQERAALQAVKYQQGPEPAIVLNAEKAWAGPAVLMPLATSSDPRVRSFAIRAIGRLEIPAQVPQLLALARSGGGSNGDIASAIAQSLKGFDPNADPALLSNVLEWMRGIGLDHEPAVASDVSLPIGRIAYANPEQVHGAEEVVAGILGRTAGDSRQAGAYRTAMQSAESLARLNARVTTLGPETVKRLVRSVNKSATNDFLPGVRRDALAALIAGRGLDPDTERQALHDTEADTRRIAMAVLAGGGAGLDGPSRVALIQEGLGDESGFVRYEALRAYVRHGAQTGGCQPLLNMLQDTDSHVVLAALDALGDLCKDNEDVTMRVTAEVRTPPVIGSWNREAHAFVALAKRAPDDAAIAMGAFVTHPLWWVRMYAVRAAAAAGDLVHLEKLAYDASDNVREAALGALRRLAKGEADPAIVAALDRPDYQLLRTAAILLKDSPRNDKLCPLLTAALMRVTKEAKETSRDTRLALLEAIAIHGSRDDGITLLPLLKDFDPKVAVRASEVIGHLTGKTAIAEPTPVLRGWPPQSGDLNQCVTVVLKSGHLFSLAMNPAAARFTVDRFLKLATIDHYYDGLSIHRVVPNFLIQGGSPGANEYAGHKEYMRDEIAATNTRGSVGLSTRGRNTADAQFYINLVDNRRLDYDYTIFAHVSKGMDAVDGIEEGEEIRTVRISSCK